MKKFVAFIIAFAVALFCAATILSPAVAGAETHKFVLYNYDIEAGWFEGEPALLVIYTWQGEEYAFAWDELRISPWRPIWIEVLPDGHCWDANYVPYITTRRLPKGSPHFFYFTDCSI